LGKGRAVAGDRRWRVFQLLQGKADPVIRRWGLRLTKCLLFSHKKQSHQPRTGELTRKPKVWNCIPKLMKLLKKYNKMPDGMMAAVSREQSQVWCVCSGQRGSNWENEFSQGGSWSRAGVSSSSTRWFGCSQRGPWSLSCTGRSLESTSVSE
jgi:hypothetical protein